MEGFAPCFLSRGGVGLRATGSAPTRTSGRAAAFDPDLVRKQSSGHGADPLLALQP